MRCHPPLLIALVCTAFAAQAQAQADRLFLDGATLITPGQCAAYTVHAEDAASLDAPVASDSLVDLGGAGSSGAFYAAADTTCSGAPITAVTILTGQATAGLNYRKDDTVGSPVTLTATDRAAQGDDLSAAAGSFPVTVADPVADRLFLDGEPLIEPGECGAYTVHSDAQNNAGTPVVADSLVDLGGAGANGAFYAAADTTCTGAPLTAVTILAGQATADFNYRKDDSVGSPVTLTASDRAAQGDDLSAADGSFPVTVMLLVADRLYLDGPPLIEPGECASYRVHADDQTDSAKPVLSDSLVDLGGAGANGAFYAAADTTCTGAPVSDVTILTGQATADFNYRKDDSVGSPVTLTATDRAAQGDDLSAADASFQVTVMVLVADRLYMDGPPLIQPGDCAVYSVHADDETNAGTPVLSDSLVDLGGAGANGAFYAAADTTCTGAPVTDVTILTGQATVDFNYRKDDTVGSPVTLTATDRAAQGDDLSAADASFQVTVEALVADRLYMDGPASIAPGQCATYMVHADDQANAGTPVLSDSLVDLGGAGSNAAFYAAADTTCSGGAISAVTILAGQVTSEFNYRKTDTVGSPVTLTATDRPADGDDLSASDGSFAVTLANPAADRLRLDGDPDIEPGQCAAYTVHAENVNNADMSVLADSLVDLGGAGSNGAFYAAGDVTCSGAALTAVTLLTGQATAGFNYRKTDTVGSPVTLTATDRPADGDDLSATDGSFAVTVFTPVADRLFLEGVVMLEPGQCGLLTVHAEDGSFGDRPVLSDSLVDLGGAGSGGAFYAANDPTCSGTPGTTVTLLTGQATASFHYAKADSVGSPATLTAVDRPADGDDLSAANGSHQVTVSDPAADRLFLGGPGQIAPGECATYTVHAEDMNFSDQPVLSDSVVDLSGAGTNGAFYANGDITCSGATVTSVTLLTGQATTTFNYAKTDTAGSPVTLTAVDRAADGDDLSAGNGGVVVTVAIPVADRLLLEGASPIVRGQCARYTVHAEDAQNADTAVVSNSLIDLGGAGSSGAFFTDADVSCAGTAISEVTLLAGQATVSFRYRKDDVLGSPVTLTASDRPGDGDDLSATNGSFAVSVLPTAPDRLAVTGPTAVLTSDCSLYDVHAREASGADSAVIADSLVDLGGAGAGGAFYAPGDSGCAGPALTEVTIGAGQTSASFRFRKSDPTGSPVSLTASDRAGDGDDLSAAGGSLAVTVTLAPADRLALSGPAGVLTNQCRAYTVIARNVDSVDVPVVSDSAVDLAGAGSGGAFYASEDASCAGAAQSAVTIPAGQTNAVFRYRKTNTFGSPVTLTASDRAAQGDELSAASGSAIVGVSLAPPDRLGLSGPGELGLGECALYTVHSQESTPIDSAVVTNSMVDLSGAGMGGGFYAEGDATCSGAPINEALLASGEVSAGFRYMKTSSIGGPVELVASDRASDGDDLSAANGSLQVLLPAAVPSVTPPGAAALVLALLGGGVAIGRRRRKR